MRKYKVQIVDNIDGNIITTYAKDAKEIGDLIVAELNGRWGVNYSVDIEEIREELPPSLPAEAYTL